MSSVAETKKLPGSEGANFPFWAPDSQHVAFFAGGRLKTIGATGGSVQTLCEARQGRGGSWGHGGVIAFSPDIAAPISRVSESGAGDAGRRKRTTLVARRETALLREG